MILYHFGHAQDVQSWTFEKCVKNLTLNKIMSEYKFTHEDNSHYNFVR
jgi:hypothetical protein